MTMSRERECSRQLTRQEQMRKECERMSAARPFHCLSLLLLAQAVCSGCSRSRVAWWISQQARNV